ncbi:MAG: EamA family transporter [Proteobacteria bacterium]|nr:EamA family transporter [Pseudomonadota bacterium]
MIGTIAQLALTQALKETEPTAVLPFDFLKLVWATLLGMWVFGELPDLVTWIGAMVVFASGFFLAWREYQARRAAGKRAPAAASRPPP